MRQTLGGDSAAHLPASEKMRYWRHVTAMATAQARRLGQLPTLWRTRRQLARLTADQLRDIGLTEEQQRRESRRWF